MTTKRKDMPGFRPSNRGKWSEKRLAELLMLRDQERSKRNVDLIGCDGCGKQFNLITARIVLEETENTLTGLPNRNAPRVECPHCGLIQ